MIAGPDFPAAYCGLNRFYGFRVPLTLENTEIWYAVNNYCAKRQLIVAGLELLTATGLYFWPHITVDAYALSVLGVFTATFSIALIQSPLYMKTLK